MILIIDGDYNDEKHTAHMAGVLLDNHTDKSIAGFIATNVENISEYESGSFYKRELKGVESLLNKLNLDEIDLIIVDGFAKFNDGEHKSLGEHIYDKYYKPVIGVAKKWCEFCKIKETEVYRGKSGNPLYVTVVGGNTLAAKNIISEMYGDNRIPYAIKLADSLARKNKVTLDTGEILYLYKNNDRFVISNS